MKSLLIPSLKLTLLLILICGVVYPLLIAGVGFFAPFQGRGNHVSVGGKVVGYANIGQKFNKDEYFWSRPSAVDYTAAGSGGSNKGPFDPDYLKVVQSRMDTFLRHNPNVGRGEIPVELLTASGSGLDPDISPEGALVQVQRIAKARQTSPHLIDSLVYANIERPLWGLFGPAKVNVLKLNVALNKAVSEN